MKSNRIIDPLVTSALDYGRWSDARSGRFTQLRIQVPYE